ncbi:hypothetical protein GCM10025768_08360 [Microbacterium pseudoresistens]|uniref:Quercetin dioxygenase-like cupin family protein n=1 Tax=Microbacterium pseudoresistens TaxID=640634 RepID=A0A7Y9EVE3_9MICO|nr:cupin domain-containing protein [Microbacterium pseudoresistens]NYD54673.1 quercetin dioxygenase-like cupin family protein [Microbacterium pseudoresistens]
MDAAQPAVLVASSLQELIDAVPTEEGRVRPHRTLDAEGVKVRTLAFDAGVVMREHRAPVPILVQVLTGRILFRVDGIEHDLAPGGTIQVAASVPHELEAVEPSHVLLVLAGR